MPGFSRPNAENRKNVEFFIRCCLLVRKMKIHENP
jgi:hypothetical protein